MRLRRELLLGFALIVLVLPATAYDKTSDQDLQNEYGGKVLTLRWPFWGPRLHFDAGGGLVGSGSIASWTVGGQVRVREIDLKNGLLRIRGQRLFLFYDPATKSLRDAGTLGKDDPARKYFRKKIDEWVASVGKVEIELETGEPEPTMADVTRSMNAVFLAPGELLTDAVPIFWKRYLQPKDAPPKEAAKPDEGSKVIFNIGKGVLPPHASYNPDPPYSDLAREAKYQGTSILSLIVGENGVPRHIRIATPLGMGLDDHAERVVEKWKFDPGTKDGTSVAVWIMVEVNFRLY